MIEDIFPTAPHAHCTFTPTEEDERGKLDGVYKTIKSAAPASAYEKHVAGEVGLLVIPIRPDNFCTFGVIDIDFDADNHDPVFWAKYCATNSPEFHVAVSKSGCAHLYVIPEEPIPASKMRQFLAEKLKEFELPSNTERFPKQDKLEEGDVGNGINIPYFGNERPVLDANGEPMTLEKFAAVVNRVPCSLFDVPGRDLTTATGRVRAGELAEGNRHNDLKTFAMGYLKQGIDIDTTVVALKAQWFETYGDEDRAERDQLIKWLRKRGKEGGFDCDDFTQLIAVTKAVAMDNETKTSWILVFRGHHVEIKNEDVLFSAAQVQKAIASQTQLFADITVPSWKRRLSQLMDNVTITEDEGGSDAETLIDALKFWLSRETMNRRGFHVEDRSRLKHGDCWLDEERGRLWFNPSGAPSAINKLEGTVGRCGRKDVLRVVKYLEGGSDLIKIGGKAKRWYWIPWQEMDNVIEMNPRKTQTRLVVGMEGDPEEDAARTVRTIEEERPF